MKSMYLFVLSLVYISLPGSRSSVIAQNSKWLICETKLCQCKSWHPWHLNLLMKRCFPNVVMTGMFPKIIKFNDVLGWFGTNYATDGTKICFRWFKKKGKKINWWISFFSSKKNITTAFNNLPLPCMHMALSNNAISRGAQVSIGHRWRHKLESFPNMVSRWR